MNKSLNRAVVLATALYLLSGCSSADISKIRPEINRWGGLRVFPEHYMTTDGEGMMTTPGVDSSEDTGEAPETESNVVSPLPYDVVVAETYGDYLRSNIFDVVSGLLRELPSESVDKLYFRVFHRGCSSKSEDTTLISESPVMDYVMAGSINTLGGKALPTLTYEWLSKLPINASVISRYQSSMASLIDEQISKGVVSLNTRWVEMDDSVNNYVRYMLGGPAFSETSTVEDLKTAVVSGEVIGVVPNIELSIQNSPLSSSTRKVWLNRVDYAYNPSVVRYTYGTDRASVNYLFTSYNQYPSRNAEVVDMFFQDDQSILYSYIDGYSKTLVLLATDRDNTLEDLLGEQFGQVESVLGSVVSYTDIEAVTGALNRVDVPIFIEGSKGEF